VGNPTPQTSSICSGVPSQARRFRFRSCSFASNLQACVAVLLRLFLAITSNLSVSSSRCARGG
jgi:hypothetical protein